MLSRRRLAMTLAAPIALTPLGGCLITSHSDTRTSGAFVAREDLVAIDPGMTTREVERRLGPPTSKAQLDHDAERWVYRWQTTTEGSGSVFLIFGGSSQREVVQQVAITFEQGLVTGVERL
jgi:outer membrane protein assembly factor BamE (lipoprotein component of BamABCDE complex)